ncbi:hypothetical protein HDA32_003967 [Spinactinospora alkalitolerans]|uniref:PqqD family protein n=1 Tax=Spinactinospora alkalitolerans TaxID=687207 RepID=A0A852TZX7_9ACTN|nr:PqqD family protein [Spinactinospora alkalitolerans]NYE48847.1 hypothetical protein [Spinactinospora alkalitolerans]
MRTGTPAADTHFVVTDEGAMLLNLATGKFFGLNPTAAAIWTGLAEGTEPAAIAAGLAPSFNVSEERLFADVRRLVETLRGHGLLTDAGDRT